jgi:hypothetical protein
LPIQKITVDRNAESDPIFQKHLEAGIQSKKIVSVRSLHPANVHFISASTLRRHDLWLHPQCLHSKVETLVFCSLPKQGEEEADTLQLPTFLP